MENADCFPNMYNLLNTLRQLINILALINLVLRCRQILQLSHY